jgi:hypothetical protein
MISNPGMWLKTAARVFKTLKRRQENRAEKRMDAPICQGLAQAAGRLTRVYGEAATGMLRQFGRASRIAEDAGQL